jgi:hypothetical protein
MQELFNQRVAWHSRELFGKFTLSGMMSVSCDYIAWILGRMLTPFLSVTVIVCKNHGRHVRERFG